MLPSPHVIQIKTVDPVKLYSTQTLADAFCEFTSASSKLEASYSDLQREVAALARELACRNAALAHSVAENERMRVVLQQMLDSMPCGVMVLAGNRSIVMINPEGRRLLAMKDLGVLGVSELSDRPQFNIDYCLTDLEGNLEREFCVSSDTGKRWLSIRNRSLVIGPKGINHPSSLESICIIRDITRNKEAEAERESNRNAVALAEISSILAHEIRNPLASMELFAGLIAEDPERNTQWVSHLRAGIRMLSGTVNNVLSLHAGSTPPLIPIDLDVCVQGSVEFIRPIAEQAGVSLRCEVNDVRRLVQANENAIRQVIVNVVCNAIRHTPAGGKVIVSMTTNSAAGKSSARVEVIDTGCGIPDYAMKQLFEAGFSVAGNSPGLGLTVCKRLMIHHGGEIRVTNNVDHGTTVRLEFPIL
jgi:two-component system sensor histidine kinase FlrB